MSVVGKASMGPAGVETLSVLVNRYPEDGAAMNMGAGML
jgi:hypothetical protein